MSQKKKLYLLDAMALIYRAYFALNKNPRINSKGQNTSAVLGFANSLYDILKNEKPDYLGVAFDTIAPTVRHEEFADYKATREDMPDDIVSSIPYIKKLIEAFNIPLLYVDGYEADDVIGTLAKKAEKEGFEVFMVTPDKDFGQLISGNIFMYKPARMGNKAEIIGVKEVCEKYGIKRPEQLIDILGLWGDTSDNIPGVPGIGEKTASKLIHEFESIDNLLEHTDKLKGKQKENLENFADQARMSRDLATIILDVPIEFIPEKLKISDPDAEALKAIFEELEFRAFAKRVFTDLSVDAAEVTAQADLFSDLPEAKQPHEPKGNIKNLKDFKTAYRLVQKEDEIDELIKMLEKEKHFCFDTETTGTDPNASELVGVSFSVKPHSGYFLSLPDNYNEALKVLKKFKKLFEDPGIEKTGQNLKFDIAMLKWYEIDVQGKFFDTMIAHYLIEPDLRHGMDYLAETYLNYKTISYDEVTEKSRKGQLSMREVQAGKIRELVDYACEDTDITLQLRDKFEPELKKYEILDLFNEMEIPLMKVLASMEAEGIKLDIPTLEAYSEELGEEIEKVEKEIHTAAGSEFNIASPKQLGVILFEELKITEKPKLTKTKQYSTSEDVLQKLTNKHPIVEKILDYRSLTKLKSTYVDALPALVNKRDGRIHTSYMQTVAATGRLSSQNPNLQNIPIRTDKGREIRKAFVPRNNNYTLLAADYSQIELRIIAELSRDKGMTEAFLEGLDIHAATASKVYGVDLDQVTKDMRRNAKTVNFGIVYGISAFGLSERLNIPRGEAKEIIDAYFDQYPGVKKYMEGSIGFARKHGYVKTIMGRRRYLRDINASNSVVRGFAERNAINAPIQGSSADMIKIAMIRIFNELRRQKLKSQMILQVHDELVFDVLKEEVEVIKPIIGENMKNAIKMSVPVEVDMNSGENWLVAH
ncbi:MAG: DNA polymerase I [Bacteroidota bacterium]|nr:DNA polymerase I [Bacteroidota bacterium]